MSKIDSFIIRVPKIRYLDQIPLEKLMSCFDLSRFRVIDGLFVKKSTLHCLEKVSNECTKLRDLSLLLLFDETDKIASKFEKCLETLLMFHAIMVSFS